MNTHLSRDEEEAVNERADRFKLRDRVVIAGAPEGQPQSRGTVIGMGFQARRPSDPMRPVYLVLLDDGAYMQTDPRSHYISVVACSPSAIEPEAGAR